MERESKALRNTFLGVMFLVVFVMVLMIIIIVIYTLKLELERNISVEKTIKLNKDLKASVKNQNIQFRQAVSELEGFAYTVSHDLRAPLRHIDSFAKLWYAKLNNPDTEINNYYHKVINASGAMMKMIDGLLAFSRLGIKNTENELVQMNDLINNIINEVKLAHNTSNVLWIIKDMPNVIGDYRLLHLAFSNIIVNAVKFTSKKTTSHIEIGANKKNDYIEYYIKDNGVGFNMLYYEKLFGVFQRLHSTEEFAGIGIGLAYVKQIIIKHNGEVRAESEPDKGAIFFIKLPNIENDESDG